MPTPTDATVPGGEGAIDLDELLSRPWLSWTGDTDNEYTEVDITRPELKALAAALTAARAEVELVTVERDMARKMWGIWKSATKSAIGPRSPHAIPVDYDTADAALTAFALATPRTSPTDASQITGTRGTGEMG